MYFDSNQVNAILVCKKCESRPDEPRLLECGNIICSLCYQSILLNEYREFTCFACLELHSLPEKGLPLNKPIIQMLSLETIKVSRGTNFNTLQETLKIIQKNQILLDYINHPDYLKEHFLDLKNQIQLTIELIHEKLDKMNKQFIDELDKYENQLKYIDLESFRLFKETSKELQNFNSQTIEVLKKHDLDDETLNDLNKTANLLKEKSNVEIEYFKDVKLNNRYLKFKPYNFPVSRSIIGEFNDTQLSSILDSHKGKQILKLNEIYNFGLKDNFTWTCIYRASRDGFKAIDFHARCDYKSNTLILIRSHFGACIFGGYTEQSWDSDTYNSNDSNINNELGFVKKQDSKAFIFSLDNFEYKPFKINSSPNGGIRCSKNFGPMFGKDIVIAEESNTFFNSSSDIGDEYLDPDFVHTSIKAKRTMAGSESFLVDEIEVFTNFSHQSG
jgi:hypothetical protein